MTAAKFSRTIADELGAGLQELVEDDDCLEESGGYAVYAAATHFAWLISAQFEEFLKNNSNRLDYWLDFLEQAAREGDKYLKWALPDTLLSLSEGKPVPRVLFERLGPQTKQLLIQTEISVQT